MSISQNPHFENTKFTLQEIAEVLKHHADDQLANDVISDLQVKRPRRKRAVPRAQLERMETRRKEVERLWHEGYSYEYIAEFLKVSDRTIYRDTDELGLSARK